MSKINDGGPAFPMPSGHEPRVNEITHYNEGMSLRQYAAIHLRVPSSGTDWLDAMIRESLRDEIAAKALAGLLANNERDAMPSGYASDACAFSKAMLGAREEK